MDVVWFDREEWEKVKKVVRLDHGVICVFGAVPVKLSEFIPEGFFGVEENGKIRLFPFHSKEADKK